MLRGALTRASRPSVLCRQPAAITTTTTTSSPLLRMASQAWRQSATNTRPTSIPSRGIRWASSTGGRTLERSPVLRSSQTPRNTSSGTAHTTQRLLSRTQQRSFSWTRPRRSDDKNPKGSSGSKSSSSGGGSGSKDPEPQSFSARMRKLSREYGWVALGVYLGLSVLDFPFCFALVRLVGTDRVAAVEHWVMHHVKAAVPEGVKQRWHELRSAEKEAFGNNSISEGVEEGASWGVGEAEERNKREASLATQLALAYAIHKSFIFVRVPLTAAVTPKVVKILRGWGWQIGKKKSKR